MPSLQDALRNALTQPKPQLPLDDWEQDDNQVITAKTQEKTMSNPAPVVNLVSVPDTKRPSFGITNNVSRATFNYVRDNPGRNRNEVIHALEAQGYKFSSVRALLDQFIRVGQIHKAEDGSMHTISKEYAPVRPSDLKKQREALKEKAKHAVKVAALAKAREVKAAIAAKRAEATVAQHVIAKEEPKQKYQPKAVPEGIAALQTTPASVPLVELTADKILDTLGVRQAKLLFLELKKIFEE